MILMLACKKTEKIQKFMCRNIMQDQEKLMQSASSKKIVTLREQEEGWGAETGLKKSSL